MKKNLLLLKDIEGELQINKIKITKASYRIRIYNLPLHAMNENVGRLIGETIGSIEEFDVESGKVAWEEFP